MSTFTSKFTYKKQIKGHTSKGIEVVVPDNVEKLAYDTLVVVINPNTKKKRVAAKYRGKVDGKILVTRC